MKLTQPDTIVSLVVCTIDALLGVAGLTIVKLYNMYNFACFEETCGIPRYNAVVAWGSCRVQLLQHQAMLKRIANSSSILRDTGLK